MVGRISTFVLTNRLNSENLRVQTDLARTQMQISTGKKGSSYEEIGRDTMRLLNIQNDLSRINTQNIVSSNVSSRIEQMYSSINNMKDLANQVASTLAQSQSGALSVPQEVANVTSNAEQALASLLNINFGGRYLFAGDRLDTPPVDLADPGYTTQPVPSVANTSYYQGDAGIASAEISDGFTVNYGVRADNQAFEKFFRALNLAANNSADPAARGEALDLVRSSIDDMAAIQTDLSAKANLIDTQRVSNEEDATLFKSVIANITETDLAEASVNLTNYQSQLEASYATLTRITRLKLANYL